MEVILEIQESKQRPVSVSEGKGQQTKENEMSNKPGETSTMSVTNRSTSGLRSTLFDELDALRNGTSNPARSNAVAKLADQLMCTVRLELDFHKHLAKHPIKPDAPQISTSVSLG